jgi:hypothetical protein
VRGAVAGVATVAAGSWQDTLGLVVADRARGHTRAISQLVEAEVAVHAPEYPTL